MTKARNIEHRHGRPGHEKAPHRTYEGALAHCQNLLNKGCLGKTPYICDTCGYYHVGYKAAGKPKTYDEGLYLELGPRVLGAVGRENSRGRSTKQRTKYIRNLGRYMLIRRLGRVA